jgi:hypothetical protein
MMEATCSSETSVDFSGLHDVISQKIELFIMFFCLHHSVTKSFKRFQWNLVLCFFPKVKVKNMDQLDNKRKIKSVKNAEKEE